ncbi:hypothetical protein MRX96_048118 [Rhipicephalus microplus]
MATIDLDRLCSTLSSVQAGKLYCLDGDISLPIPKITGMSVPEAIAAIRSSIALMSDEALFDRFLLTMDAKHVLTDSLAITEERIHACSLVPESESPTTGHDAYCFTFWTSSPCVALYKPREGYSSEVHNVLGNTLGGDPTDFERGEYLDQDVAHNVAMSLAPSSRAS